MRSRARAFGHAIHPMMITLPLGLLSMAVVFDIIHLATDRYGFAISAAYTMGAGIVTGVAAAVFGLVDWLAIPRGTRARRIGTLHGLGNVAVLVLFALSWLTRLDQADWRPDAAAVLFGLGGLLLAGVTGWLGGELVERLGVGVDDDARLDAPNSLTRASLSRAGRPQAHR
jgi:uncharacterized membrane protein